MGTTVNILGHDYDKNIDALLLDTISNSNELVSLKKFPNLKYIGLYNSNIDDQGLKYLSASVTIDNVNLQGTAITDKGIAYLSNLTQLKYLRLKECDQITNNCITHINSMIHLEDLQIQETNIDQQGLQHLALANLRFICLDIWEGNYTYNFLTQFSKRFPDCEILAKGKGSFQSGQFDGIWV